MWGDGLKMTANNKIYMIMSLSSYTYFASLTFNPGTKAISVNLFKRYGDSSTNSMNALTVDYFST